MAELSRGGKPPPQPNLTLAPTQPLSLPRPTGNLGVAIDELKGTLGSALGHEETANEAAHHPNRGADLSGVEHEGDEPPDREVPVDDKARAVPTCGVRVRVRGRVGSPSMTRPKPYQTTRMKAPRPIMDVKAMKVAVSACLCTPRR